MTTRKTPPSRWLQCLVRPLLEWAFPPVSSSEIIAAATRRYDELNENYGFEWRSFYNGYLEGSILLVTAPHRDRAEMLRLIDDMLSVYRGGTTVVTEERHEAWRALRAGWANVLAEPAKLGSSA